MEKYITFCRVGLYTKYYYMSRMTIKVNYVNANGSLGWAV